MCYKSEEVNGKKRGKWEEEKEEIERWKKEIKNQSKG